MPPRIAKLAALGAFAASLGILGIYMVFLYGTSPDATSGMDATSRFIAWLSVAGVILALVGVHVAFGRQLLALSKEVGE